MSAYSNLRHGYGLPAFGPGLATRGGTFEVTHLSYPSLTAQPPTAMDVSTDANDTTSGMCSATHRTVVCMTLKWRLLVIGWQYHGAGNQVVRLEDRTYYSCNAHIISSS